MIRMIAAASRNGVIGKNNSLPFHYKEDMKFFRSMTALKEDRGSTVIMGKKTFQSMNNKPLPKRHNIVITRSTIENIETAPSVHIAMSCIKTSELTGFEEADVWFIGGTNIYRDGMNYASEIYLTLIPEVVTGDDLAYFPWIDPTKFQVKEYLPLFDETGKQTLQVAKYIKIQ